MTFARHRDDGYSISTERDRLDRALIHRFLSEEAYWSPGIPAEHVDRCIDNSLCFGVYEPGGLQVAFARVLTDYGAIAYLGDVFVIAEHRGRGLGKWLVEVVLDHPDLQHIRSFLLGTADAHGLYARHGFEPTDPERWMVRKRDPKDLYDG